MYQGVSEGFANSELSVPSSFSSVHEGISSEYGQHGNIRPEDRRFSREDSEVSNWELRGLRNEEIHRMVGSRFERYDRGDRFRVEIFPYQGQIDHHHYGLLQVQFHDIPEGNHAEVLLSYYELRYLRDCRPVVRDYVRRAWDLIQRL